VEGQLVEKKPSPAKLKKKGAYLPQSEQPAEPSADAAPAEVVHISPRTYQRSRWKHLVRAAAFLFIVFLDVASVGQTIDANVRHHVSTAAMGKEAFLFVMLVIANCLVLPSIALEADRIEVNDESIIIRNLLLKCTINWNEITAVSAPIYLKFAIIKTRRFFQLINKRDIPDFNELMQTIQTKTGKPSK
jgi:hypothetical protein